MTSLSASNPAPLPTSTPPKYPQFPPHNAPRVWFLTDGLTPIALSLSRHLLEHGDYVVAGILPSEFASPRGEELRGFLEECAARDNVGLGGRQNGNAEGDDRPRKRWKDRFRVIVCDCRITGQCQAAIAEAIGAFGRIDVLLNCRSEALVGSVEELSQSTRTISLVRDQFETNFYAAVNIIKAALPDMRDRKNGHIIVVTGITAHLGTPGLGMYCAAQWALEGYCDSLAYEIAPFNMKMTIVQPNVEIPVLTNKITSVPPLPEYSPDVNPAPVFREILGGLLDRLEGRTLADHTPTASASLTSPVSVDDSSSSPPTNASAADVLTTGDLLSASTVSTLHPSLQPQLKTSLIQETVFALAAIGGHDNPPGRHIVGFEGVASVKEKLKTVSEELEDFIDVSSAVDIAGENETNATTAGGIARVE